MPASEDIFRSIGCASVTEYHELNTRQQLKGLYHVLAWRNTVVQRTLRNQDLFDIVGHCARHAPEMSGGPMTFTTAPVPDDPARVAAKNEKNVFGLLPRKEVFRTMGFLDEASAIGMVATLPVYPDSNRINFMAHVLEPEVDTDVAYFLRQIRALVTQSAIKQKLDLHDHQNMDLPDDVLRDYILRHTPEMYEKLGVPGLQFLDPFEWSLFELFAGVVVRMFWGDGGQFIHRIETEPLRGDYSANRLNDRVGILTYARAIFIDGDAAVGEYVACRVPSRRAFLCGECFTMTMLDYNSVEAPRFMSSCDAMCPGCMLHKHCTGVIDNQDAMKLVPKQMAQNVFFMSVPRHDVCKSGSSRVWKRKLSEVMAVLVGRQRNRRLAREAAPAGQFCSLGNDMAGIHEKLMYDLLTVNPRKKEMYWRRRLCA